MDAPTATPATPPTTPPVRRGRPRATPRPVPSVSGEYEHLTLEALRSYRSALQTEEGKVSYWRRILQARLDVVRGGRFQGGTGTLDAAALRPVLTAQRVTSLRNALVEVVPVHDFPPLPDLADLWERQVDPADADAQADLETDLTAAEQQLSTYRTALHVRLGDATAELIARYRGEPTLCLAVLPLSPGRSRV
jgi:hypothetical protein